MIEQIATHCKHILKENLNIKNSSRVLILYDDECELTQLLMEGARRACENLANSFDLVNYSTHSTEQIVNDIDEFYRKDDVVFLIQSSSFRASKFRWRNELCSRGLGVIEFGQLQKILPHEYQCYVDSLTYDYPRYVKLIDSLTHHIKTAKTTTIISQNGCKVTYKGPLDKPITNDGNFEGLVNKGSRYPIGEVITEGLDLSYLSGEIEVYAFPNKNQETQFVKPFTCKIEKGLLVSHNGPKEFDEIVEMIKTEHPSGSVYVRELGLGLNRFIKRFSRLGDPIAYERQEGVHFSLGMKHGMYQKKLWPKYGKKFNQKYHIDVYVNVDRVYFDKELVYSYPDGFIVDKK